LMADFAVIGHVAIDRIITDQGERIQLGGPPTYVSLVARKLGKTVRTVTKVGGDIPDDFISQLEGLGVDIEGMIIEGSETTRFILDYRGAERRLSVGSVCEVFGPEDLVGLPEVVLLAPIAGETPPSVLINIKSDMIALDPQGFVRDIRPNGTILPKRWFDENLMRRLTIYKSSEDELRLVTGNLDTLNGLEKIIGLGAEVAIATKGGEGALLVVREGRYKVPVLAVGEALDPTGAGDTFIGGFFSEYLDGEDPSWCASMGAAMASCVVETVGARIDASRKLVRERAEDVYNRVVKL
jgi:sugar/nucleoside kinase (ribokinase family)